MTRSPNSDAYLRPEQRVSGLVELARRTLDEDLSPKEQAGLVRFEQTIARRTLGAGRKRVWAYALSVAAAGGVALALMTVNPLAVGTALTYSVVGGTVGDGGYVRAGNDARAEIRFSDGSNLALDPGTSTRVTELAPNGSRVFLEGGHAHVRVTHRPHARWTVEAGPYSIRVVGTEFDVRWSVSDEMFDVQLHKGAIIVSGPLAARGLSMEAGQRLVANVKQGEIFLDRAAAGESGESPSGSGAAAPEEGPSSSPETSIGSSESRGPTHALAVPGAHRGLGRSAGPAPDRDPPSWSRRVAGGDFHGVLADAERRGLDAIFGSAAVGDLAALADAARYVRRSDVARRALLAERNRFPKSREAREAAFFLGGLSEDEPGTDASTEALTWYDRYLDESASGSYAAHALGREMILVHKLRGPAAARPMAERYLERFPTGPYAAAARKLTQLSD